MTMNNTKLKVLDIVEGFLQSLDFQNVSKSKRMIPFRLMHVHGRNRTLGDQEAKQKVDA